MSLRHCKRSSRPTLVGYCALIGCSPFLRNRVAALLGCGDALERVVAAGLDRIDGGDHPGKQAWRDIVQNDDIAGCLPGADELELVPYLRFRMSGVKEGEVDPRKAAGFDDFVAEPPQKDHARQQLRING